MTVSNPGTAALNFSAVSYAADFSESPAGSTDCTPSTKLNAGQTCTLTIDFLPTTALGGKTSLLLNESVSITTNTLNATATKQAVSVSGTEVLPGGSVNLNVSANPSTAGGSVTFTATVAGSTGGPTPTGSVTFYNGATALSGAISLTNGAGAYSTASLTTGTYSISASYSGDSNYAASTSNTISESILATPSTAPFGNTNAGTQNIGSTSSVIPLTITFNEAETLGNIAVLTQGAPNLDFANAGGGTCTVGNAYTANSTCTVNVTFTPQYPGERNGAVVLFDNNNNVIGTGYLEGIGVGPQTSFPPGYLTPELSDCTPNGCTPLTFGYAQGVAVDGSGNFYVADAAKAFYREDESSGVPFDSTIGSGFTDPYGIAVDAAGNVYLADRGSHVIYKETPYQLQPTHGTYVQTVIGYGFGSPVGVAVDSFGNVYVADSGNGTTPGAVYMETLSNGSYTQTKIAGTFVTPQGVAVDGNGDIFVADSANGNGSAAVYKLTPTNGTYTQSSIGYGWVTPSGIAVDGNGNVFVSDNAYDLGDGFVAEESLQPDGTYTQTTIANSTSIPYPAGIALDIRGNRFICSNLETTYTSGSEGGLGSFVYIQDVADPPGLGFAATEYGQVSSDSPKNIIVQNAGNAVLTFSSLSYPADFPEAPGVPTDCTAQSSLQIGSSCTLSANFEPGTPLSNGQSQTLSENVTINTNSLGGSTQSFGVSGTEATPAASVALTTPANVFVAGATVTFTATVTGQSGLATPTGSVTFSSESTNTALGTSPLSGNGTAMYSTNSLATAVDSIIATYSGDQIYESATSSPVILNIIPNSTFGTENIGTANSIPVTVTFSSSTTLGGIAVLTDGMQNLDFTNAGGGTCTIGNPYTTNSSCTVNVLFTPRFSGVRHGALVLTDNTGKLIQTIYVSGTGIGPQVAFQPATSTTVFTESSTPCAQVVDSSGDIYVSLSTNGTCGAITKWAPYNGSYTHSTVTSSALSSQIDIDLDAAGNVYIADTNNGRVLKETLLNGTYSESVIASGLSIPRLVKVIGSGEVYFVVGIYNGTNNASLYEEVPSSSGGYTQTVLNMGGFFRDPIGLEVDDQGNFYVDDHDTYCCDSNGANYFLDVVEFNPWTFDRVTGGAENQVVSLNFMDANGNVYVTWTPDNYEFVHELNQGWTGIPMPLGGWGMDGSGNLYRTVDNVVTKVNFASPPSLRFAQTTVGSESSDSPKTAILENIGNAPLIFSVPSSGTNPSVSTNFALDASSTCPQIGVAGSPLTLAMDDSCTYALNFAPSTTGMIDGSLIASDNVLNAIGGTQTISLSGSGTSGINGNVAFVVLTIGPEGAPQGSVVPNLSPTGAGNAGNIWVDTTHRTFVQGAVYLQTDSQGNPTCNLYSQTQLTASRQPQFGTIYFTTENYQVPWCGSTLFPYQVARYTWGPDQPVEQDPLILQYRTADGTAENNFAFTAILARVTVGPAFPGTSASNSPLTATATLTNPPIGAQGYDWQIIGGNGAIVFPNGQEAISSTTNAIPVEWPNPTANSVPYDIKVGVRYSGGTDTYTAAESDPLLYGPTSDTFISIEKGNGKCPDEPGNCAGGDPISIGTGNVFEQVVDYETAGQNKLSYIRYYNSLAGPTTYATTLGLKWRSNYDRYLKFVSSEFIQAERPDGQVIDFHPSGSTWVSDSDVDYTLTQSGTTWTLTDHDDTIETYTQFSSGEGQLQSIALRNGYTQTMTYDGNNHLSTVTDSYSRQLSFTYASGVVSTVTTPDGLVLTYDYNSVQSLWDELASVSYSTSPVTSQHYLYQQASVPYALTAIADENGDIYETWTYDDQGRGLSNQVGGAANRITVSYDDTTMTRTVANAFGVVDTYAFSILQNLPKVTQISRAATINTAATSETFRYDSNGYLSSETDWDGNETTYVNDSHGDPTSINEAVGAPVARTTTIAYDPTWVHLPETITTPGLTTSFTYDGNGEVLTKTLTDTATQSVPYSTNGSTWEWQYTWQNSLLASVQSPRTDVVEKISYTYDSTGALTAITNPLNQETTIASHTGGGLPLTIDDPNGVTTTITYDPRQHLLTSTTAGHETKYGYDAAENLTSVTQPDGSGLSYSYDSAHRLTGIKDLLGQSISYTLDALGNPESTDISNSSGTETSQHSNSYDALGRMLKDIGAASQTSSFTYDAMGNMLTATDQASNTTHRVFDALNRLDKITDPAAGITTTSYDAHDRPLNVTAPTGGTSAYVYDGIGDLIQESSPNTGTTVYYYDSTGNLTKRVAATGAVTQYTYDALDRVLTMTFPADSAENVAYNYDQSGHGDSIGRLTSVTDAAGSLSRSYDQFGNLTTDVRTTTTANLTTAYSYDGANRIASITYPSGAVVSYTRDIMGRVTAVNAQPPGGSSTPVVSNIAYEPFGPSTTLTYGNGVAESRGFDQDYRLTALTDTGSSALQNLSYAYYPTNNVHTITDAVNSGNSQTFSYDYLQRLNQATGGYGSYGFTYDNDGNRLTQSLGGVTTNYGFGTANDLLQTLTVGGVQTQAIGYTADGRMASFSPGIQAPGGQYITSLSYNQDARLSAVNAASGALASYTYDGFGQRLIKTISGTNGEIYQYGQNGLLLEETNASGVAQADYIYLNGRLIADLAPSTGALYFLNDDMLGTPQVATDSSQTVSWQASYQPFGTASVSGTITQNLRFPGQYFDSESGWNHNGFRDYLFDLGRYAEPDPLGLQGTARLYDPQTGYFLSPDVLAGGTNSYTYVGADPVNYFDQFGLSATCGKKCFAQLKYRPVDDWRAKMFGRTHSFWYVQGSSGIQYTLSGGPWPENGDNKKLNVWATQALPSAVDNPSAAVAWSSGLSSKNCPGVDRMIGAAMDWPQNTIPYRPVEGPNSDTAAHRLGTIGGFNPPAPPGVMGWNTPLPPQ